MRTMTLIGWSLAVIAAYAVILAVVFGSLELAYVEALHHHERTLR